MQKNSVSDQNQKNPMQEIMIDKVIINIGTGNSEDAQANAKSLLEIITGKKPTDSLSKTRNPSFKISKGQKIGAFVTVRKKEAPLLLKRLFE